MTEPSWLSTARQLIGTKEKPGSSDNPVIVAWAKKIGGWEGGYYQHDDTPWCGLFVAHCLTENKITPPKGFLAALSYQNWGDKCDPAVPGAVLVFGRKGGGHVGFYVSEDDTAYHVLGGNQSDAVTITRVAKDRLVDARWPTGQSKGWFAAPVHVSDNGDLSRNEA